MHSALRWFWLYYLIMSLKLWTVTNVRWRLCYKVYPLIPPYNTFNSSSLFSLWMRLVFPIQTYKSSVLFSLLVLLRNSHERASKCWISGLCCAIPIIHPHNVILLKLLPKYPTLYSFYHDEGDDESLFLHGAMTPEVSVDVLALNLLQNHVVIWSNACSVVNKSLMISVESSLRWVNTVIASWWNWKPTS